MNEFESAGHIDVDEELALLLDRIAQSDGNIGSETLARLITAKSDFAKFLRDTNLQDDPDAIAILNLTQRALQTADVLAAELKSILASGRGDLDLAREWRMRKLERDQKLGVPVPLPTGLESGEEVSVEIKRDAEGRHRIRKVTRIRKPELMKALALALELALVRQLGPVPLLEEVVVDMIQQQELVLRELKLPLVGRETELMKALVAQVLELAHGLARNLVQEKPEQLVERVLQAVQVLAPELERALDREVTKRPALDRRGSPDREAERRPSLNPKWRKE